MDELKPGVSGPKVLALQKRLNAVLPSIRISRLKENGDYDDAMETAVGAFQEAAEIGSASGSWDAKSEVALNDALAHRKTVVALNGSKYQLTKQELEQLKPVAFQKAADAMDYYVNMADEAKNLWDAHNDARKNNWFWSHVVDIATGAKFPDQSVINEAVRAAASMKSDAGSGRLGPKMLESRSAPIRKAFAAMDMYRDTTFVGSDKLVDYLQDTADTCVVVLEVSAAIATGGASWQVQVGVAAGMGGYKELLAQITKASTDAKVTIEDATLSVFKQALIDGCVAVVMKGGGKGLENVGEEIAKEACKEAATNGGKVLLKQYVIKLVAKMATQIAEEVLKALGKVLTNPQQKVTPQDFVDAAVEVVVKSFAVAALGPAVDKYAEGASKKIGPGLVKALMSSKGPVDNEAVKKALSSGVANVIDKSSAKAVKTVLEKWDPNKGDKGFSDEVEKTIKNDRDVQAAVSKAVAAKGK